MVGLGAPPLTFILASASPARRSLLVNAGLAPEVIPSQINEPALLADLRGEPFTSQVLALARAKCEDVAPQCAANDFVLGCDSMFELDGELFGKPADAHEARVRLRAMAGNAGVLHTGHWLIHRGQSAHGVASTRVHIEPMTEADIDAYVGTGEPLGVAGSFTLDGIGGAFVKGIDGDPSNVVGCSLPLLRRLVEQLGTHWPDLWISTLRP
jgi:septum formation protein